MHLFMCWTLTVCHSLFQVQKTLYLGLGFLGFILLGVWSVIESVSCLFSNFGKFLSWFLQIHFQHHTFFLLSFWVSCNMNAISVVIVPQALFIFFFFPSLFLSVVQTRSFLLSYHLVLSLFPPYSPFCCWAHPMSFQSLVIACFGYKLSDWFSFISLLCWNFLFFHSFFYLFHSSFYFFTQVWS